MNKEFISALKEIEREKGISLDILIEAIEAALISAYKKNFSTTQSVRVDIDPNEGNIRVLAQREVVDEVTDERIEISLAEAQKLDPNYELGDVVENEVTPRDFGRIAAQTAKQVVVQRIREAERNIVFDEFSQRENDIIIGTVQRQESGNIFVDFGRAEGMLPLSEQIRHEAYKNGERIKVYIVEVRKTNKGPQIIVSRTHPGLIKRLFELEVPEIHDGIVEIKSVSREPGARSKVAVYAVNGDIDAVGACVGQRGARVQRVVDELGGEKIDIVTWNENPKIFVANALSPSKVVEIYTNEESRSARVVVPDNQLSLAIGKEGQNVRLAAKLTGWKIDIKSETQMEAFIEEHGGEEAFLEDMEPTELDLSVLMDKDLMEEMGLEFDAKEDEKETDLEKNKDTQDLDTEENEGLDLSKLIEEGLFDEEENSDSEEVNTKDEE